MGGQREEIQQAVRLLLEDSRVIKQDALTVLKTISDPVKLAKVILANTPSGSKISAEILDHYSKAKKNAINKPAVKTLEKIVNTERSGSIFSTIPNITPIQAPLSKITNKVSITQLPDAKQLTGLHNYEPDLKVIFNPALSDHLVGDINDMVGYFQDRFKKLSRMLRSRQYIQNLKDIDDLKTTQKDVSVIGMVTEKSFSSDSSGYLVLEDPKSENSLRAILTDSVLVEEALRIMNDSVICVQGSISKDKFYVKQIYLPDIVNSSPSRADIPVHAAFLSDIHVGSKGFLEEPMNKFIEFLNGTYGNKKMQILGSMTKYVLFAGDVVDGVGIYPNQQDDLSIDSIQDQYNEFARFVERIPEDIEMVVIPGNHDMVRSAEPQPTISPQFAPDLHNFDNVHMLPNPSQVSLHGVKTLLYHCTSLPDIMNHIPGLHIEKPIEVMKQMLRARHLAPLWGEKTPIATEPEDHLVINPIPDIFHGGHVHINGLGHYNGVKIVNSGTMQEQTSYQKSLNIDPTPGIVQLINLQTYQPSILDFLSK